MPMATVDPRRYFTTGLVLRGREVGRVRTGRSVDLHQQSRLVVKEGQHEKIDRSDGAVVEFEQINFQSKTEDLGAVQHWKYSRRTHRASSAWGISSNLCSPPAKAALIRADTPREGLQAPSCLSCCPVGLASLDPPSTSTVAHAGISQFPNTVWQRLALDCYASTLRWRDRGATYCATAFGTKDAPSNQTC
jgi:hypothetical protein